MVSPPQPLATLKLSKTDAARRQLEAAIRLWFFDGDAVSVHTLAAAAHQLVHDLGKARGLGTSLRELSDVRPEYRRKLREAIVRDENFFKHADRDPDALLEFRPTVTTYMLVDAVLTYQTLTSERPPILRTFSIWMTIQNPDLIKQEVREEWIARLDRIAPTLKRTTKQEFFSLYQAVLARCESS